MSFFEGFVLRCLCDTTSACSLQVIYYVGGEVLTSHSASSASASGYQSGAPPIRLLVCLRPSAPCKA